MPGKRCAVSTCKNYHHKIKDCGRIASYHDFPKDPKVRQSWIKFCQKTDQKFNPSTASMCSDHFLDTVIIRDLQNELMNLPVKRILNQGGKNVSHFLKA